MQFIDAEESKWMQNIADAVHKKKMQTSNIPGVPHKAVAEVSKIGTLKEGLVVVTRGWQSEPTDGPKGA